MKTVLILLTSMLLVVGCKTQQDPVVQAIQDAENKALFDKAVSALDNQNFVLEADRLTFKYGRSTSVDASTNFVLVEGDRATVQIAFNSAYAGPNGIGGITVEGKTSNVKLEADKKGNISYSMMVQGVAISANVSIFMINGTNQCSAIVTPNFSGNIITFTGSLYQKSESRVFKGRAL